MKKFGFIGAYDKIDMMIYVGKILVTLGKKVLIIDCTMRQKVRYIVPVMNQAQAYITEYEGMDVAVGFQSFAQIQQYLQIPANSQLPYDIVLIDTDNPKILISFNFNDSDRNYFVTAFDNYSIKRGIQTIALSQQQRKLTKILFSQFVLNEENEYLDFLTKDYQITWDENKIYFPLENGDSSVITENQRMEKIKFKKLSSSYKDGLANVTKQIVDDINESTIRKTIKTIERGM